MGWPVAGSRCVLIGESLSRLPGLDLLRAIAIVWVMLFHSFVIGGLGERYAWASDYGWMGVDLFFVLSGYLIGSQLLKPLSQGQPVSFGEFYLRRAFRILPAFLVVLALYFGVPAFRERPGIQPLWQFLTFTVNLLIDYQHNQAFSHAWSLCVEEHFYWLFPLLACWLTRRPSIAKFIGVCAAVVVLGMPSEVGSGFTTWCPLVSSPVQGAVSRSVSSRISTIPPTRVWMDYWPAWCWRRSRHTGQYCGRGCKPGRIF